MLWEIMKYVIERDTSEQLDELFDGLVRAVSLRSAQGMGTDETLSEMLAEVAAERNARPARG